MKHMREGQCKSCGMGSGEIQIMGQESWEDPTQGQGGIMSKDLIFLVMVITLSVALYLGETAKAQDAPFRTAPTPEESRIEIGAFSRRPRGSKITVTLMGGTKVTGKVMKSDMSVLTLESNGGIAEVRISTVVVVRYK